MINTLILTSALAGQFTAIPDPIKAGNPYLEIRHIKMMDNVDGGDALGANRADLFALVIINKKSYKTEIMSKDDGEPMWKIPLDMSRRYSNIHLSIKDEDGGLEGKDDHIDINPRGGQKDLIFTYDRYTGKIWGAVKGKAHGTIMATGGGDDDKASISFAITKSW
jgi:hypothetical protein